MYSNKSHSNKQKKDPFLTEQESKQVEAFIDLILVITGTYFQQNYYICFLSIKQTIKNNRLLIKLQYR